MKGGKEPNIAVMLGVPKGGEDGGDEDGGEQSLSEVKARAEDAAVAFAAAIKGGDAKKILATFHPLYVLCDKLHELEESGESDEEEADEPKEEAEEPTEE